MAKMHTKLGEQLRTHISNGKGEFFLDGPKNIGGKEEHITPTDALGGILSSCMLTMMGMQAKFLNLDLANSYAEVEKELSSKPNWWISRIKINFFLPDVPQDQRKKLEQAAHSCPIHNSLSPEVVIEEEYHWGAI